METESKKLTAGTKVIPRRPEDISLGPWWVEYMDKFDGVVCTIKEPAKIEDCYVLEEDEVTFWFHKDWLEEVID